MSQPQHPSPAYETRPALDVAEFGRRIALFQARSTAPKKTRTPVETALLKQFTGGDAPAGFEGFEPRESEQLAAALQAWRRPRANAVNAALFQHIFDAVPTPVAVFCDAGMVSNRAFTEILEAAGREQAGRGETRSTSEARLAATVRGAGGLNAPVLYFALGGRLFRLALRSFPELGCSAAYLHPDGRALPDLEPAVQQLLAYRLSGLSLKQIAPLLDLSYSRVEGLSKRNRRHLMRLRSETCLEPAV